MRKKGLSFLFGIIFLFMFSLVYAQSCSIAGSIQNGMYCDGNNFIELKQEGSFCSNDYECQLQSCVDGICQPRYVSLNERGSFLQNIYDFFYPPVECTPGEDMCQGELLVETCGSTGYWEQINAYVDGRCGYVADNGDDSGSGSGGGSSSGGSNMNVIVDSPRNITYSSASLPLRVYDKNRNARFWSYSLNDGPKIDFTPNITLTVKEGTNKLIVSGRKTVGTSVENSRTIVFSVRSSSTGICGDGICNNVIGETELTCSADCSPVDYCNFNGICEASEGESSNSCSADCSPVEPKNYGWLFWLLVILLLLLILLVIYMIVKKSKKKEENKEDLKQKEMKKAPVKTATNSTKASTVKKGSKSYSVSKTNKKSVNAPKSKGTSVKDLRKKSDKRFSPKK